jgi:hypothetical protein
MLTARGLYLVHVQFRYLTLLSVLRIRCFFIPWIRDEFFPDPGSRIQLLFVMKFSNFLTLFSESLLCYLFLTGLLLKLTPETVSSKKKVYLLLPPPFYIGRRIQDVGSEIRDRGWKNYRIRIRDKTSRIRNTAIVFIICFSIKGKIMCGSIKGTHSKKVYLLVV